MYKPSKLISLYSYTGLGITVESTLGIIQKPRDHFFPKTALRAGGRGPFDFRFM